MTLSRHHLTDRGVLCRGCGKLIVVYSGKPEAEYVDLILRMQYPDGSQDDHSTPLCKPCAATCTVGDAQDLYLIDLEEWGRIESERADVRAWLARMVTRVVVAVKHAV